eukprot:TRINITY_DN10414_c0_g1_i1.p1 TRINITY_DN10414_c0_g1~~TRINITY_DN10414_c0_g1_i1.p1  ORF type:complete len:111 (+),score=48.46 TRINITY_DN10414_c0_g1_i1:42-335(+)
MSVQGVALREAAKTGNAKLVQELLEAHKGDMQVINYQDKYGYTPLHLSSMFGHREIAMMILKAGADKSLANFEGENAADVAKGYVLGEEIRKWTPSN